MNPLVSVVVVTWNGKHLLRECFDALLSQTYRPFEIILVDNGSSDGTIDFVARRYGRHVRSLALGQNKGYAAGNNEGFRASKGDLLVTLNNDTHVSPTWLGALVREIGSSSDVGACASRQMRMGQGNIIDALGIGLHPNGDSFAVASGQQDCGQFDEIVEVFGAHGASAMYKREALIDAGLFDEDFFAYEEEFDLNWRLRMLGWRCLYVPDARLEHLGGATIKRKPGLHDYLKTRNRFFCILKNYPVSVLAEHLPSLAKTEVGNVYLILRGESFRLNARMGVFPYLGRMLRRRERIQTRRKITDAAFKSWLGTRTQPARPRGMSRV